MSLVRTAIVAAAVLLLGASALAQDAVDNDPEATLLSELVVVARTPGPAWWKVTRGSSQVWIMGLPPTETPFYLKWDQEPLRRRLTGARVLLVPPRGGGQAVLHDRRSRPPLAPGDLVKRYEALSLEFGAEPMNYQYKPTFSHAVHDLYVMSWRRRGAGGVRAEITALAASLNVPVSELRIPAPVPVKSTSIAQTTPQIRACLTALLDEIERPTSFELPARAWADGRVNDAVAAPRDPYDTCDIDGLWPRRSRLMIEMQAAQIEAALQTPGKAMALVPMRQLIAREGVLQRLRAAGYEVKAPSQLAEDEPS